MATSKLSVLTPEQEDVILRSRMTNDERPLRRAIKKLVTSAPSSGTPAAIGASSSAAEQWDALSSEFENVELLVTKAGLVGNMEERMRASYRAKGDEMDRSQAALREEITSLKAQLRAAEIERQHKMAYDDIARKILAVGKRDELERDIATLSNSVGAIQTTHSQLVQTLSSRKEAFDALMVALDAVRAIVPPKSETEEGEEEGVEEEGATPGQMLTGEATPAGGQSKQGSASPKGEEGVAEEDEEDDEGEGRRADPKKVVAPPLPPAAEGGLLSMASSTAATSPAPPPALMSDIVLQEDEASVVLLIAEEQEQEQESTTAVTPLPTAALVANHPLPLPASSSPLSEAVAAPSSPPSTTAAQDYSDAASSGPGLSTSDLKSASSQFRHLSASQSPAPSTPSSSGARKRAAPAPAVTEGTQGKKARLSEAPEPVEVVDEGAESELTPEEDEEKEEEEEGGSEV